MALELPPCYHTNANYLTQTQVLNQCRLTSEGRYEHVPIFDEVFDKPVCALQLDFMALQSLSELGTVQQRVAELQRRETHQ